VVLCVSLSGDNRNDVTQLLPLIDHIPAVRRRRGLPRRRPDELYADGAYDHDKYRRALHGKGIRLTTNKIPAWTFLSSRASRPA
jgi:hypothetical protein